MSYITEVYSTLLAWHTSTTVQGVIDMSDLVDVHVTGQGSLRYRNATESRTQVAPVLKAKDYALIAGKPRR